MSTNQGCKIVKATDSDCEDGSLIREVDSEIDPLSTNDDLVQQHQKRGPRLASGNLAVLETNNAPILRTADRKDILQFQQKREKYTRVHFEAGLGRTRLRSLVSMMEPVFLETICLYSIGTSIIEVTDNGSTSPETSFWTRRWGT